MRLKFLTGAGYDDTRIAFDAQIVRGLSYYTGPVYEAVLTIETTDDKGKHKGLFNFVLANYSLGNFLQNLFIQVGNLLIFSQ